MKERDPKKPDKDKGKRKLSEKELEENLRKEGFEEVKPDEVDDSHDGYGNKKH